MRDATEEERKSTKDYIDSISNPTGLQFDDMYEEPDFVRPHKKISVNLRLCEDAIPRDKVLNMLADINTEMSDGEFFFEHWHSYINKMPSVKPQTRWIPVSERLPLCEQEVLICTQSRSISGEAKFIITSAIYEDGNMRECYSRWHWEDIEYESWDEEEDCGIIPEGWWEYRHYNPDEVYNNLVDDFILAWMPLPTPYKAESEEEE